MPPTADGQLFAWGSNGYSQLGLASTLPMLSPTLVTAKLQGKRVVKVACGSHHSLALTHDGEVKTAVAVQRPEARCGAGGVKSKQLISNPSRIYGLISCVCVCVYS